MRKYINIAYAEDIGNFTTYIIADLSRVIFADIIKFPKQSIE